MLTMGYLVIEAETIWLRTIDGRVAGQALAYDQETGFGLVQAMDSARRADRAIRRCFRRRARRSRAGRRQRRRDFALSAQIVARQEFAGYWEYLLDDALYTAPAHPSGADRRCSTATARWSPSRRCRSSKAAGGAASRR